MVLLNRTLRSLHFYTVLRYQNSSQSIKNHPYNYPISLSTFSNLQPYNSSVLSLLTSSIFQRSFSDAAQLVSTDVIEEQTETESENLGVGESIKNLENKRKKNKNKKNHKKKKGKDILDALPEEGNPVSEKNGSSVKELKEEKIPTDSKLKEIKDLKSKLKKLEKEVKNLKGNFKGTEKKEILSKREVPKVDSKPNSLYSVFTSKPKSLNSVSVKNSSEMKKPVVSKKERVSRYRELKPLKKDNSIKKEISPEMIMLVGRWYEEGYLNNANFLPLKELDLNSLSTHYSRDFLRFTAERFGQDHQEIAKWLSGAELKKVSLFGCPSVERKNTFAAKRLRSFFSIQEDTVCRTCKLKNSCTFVNKRVWQKESNLNLPDVMRVLISYDLESVPEELEIPDEMTASIKKLLKEVINLSQ